MKDSLAKWMVNSGWTARALWAGIPLLAMLVGASGCVSRDSVEARKKCKDGNIEATLAYYYDYKESKPHLSDILFIEAVPPGPRSIICSDNVAPPFPDNRITSDVVKGDLKIEIPPAYLDVKDTKAKIAVYYKGNISDPDQTPVAVENVKGVSRAIRPLTVIPPGGACSPGCSSVPCDGYSCCKC